MSNSVTLNKWGGGIAEDPRTELVNQNQESLNFDIFSNPHLLSPYPDSRPETVTALAMTDVQISDVDICLIGSSYVYVGVGYTASGDTRPSFYTKSDINAAWALQATGVDPYVKGSLVVYKDKAYCLSYNGTQYTLQKFVSGGSVTTIGSVVTTATLYARPFVHPTENVLFITIGNFIGRYGPLVGSGGIGAETFTTTSTILPFGYSAVSQVNYGDYLAIAENSNRGNGNAVVYLWGRDTTLNTLQESIDFGEGSIRFIENIGNILFAFMNPAGLAGAVNQNKLVVKSYSGGAVETVTSINISTAVGQARTMHIKNGGRAFFGFDNETALYTFGKNKDGLYTLSKDRYYVNGTAIGALAGLSMLADTIFAGTYTTLGVYSLNRSKVNLLGETLTYTATSSYTTSINPGMLVEHRHLLKQLVAVVVTYTGASTGQTILNYSTDGSSMTAIITDTNIAGEQATDASNELSGTPFATGREFTFQPQCTGGSKIKEVTYKYNVLNQQV